MKFPHHHAILIEGDRDEALAAFKEHLKSEGKEIGRNPDITILDIPNFGIDESRDLIEFALRSPIQEEKRTIILLSGDMTREAQNALLKLLEDPNPHVGFLISVPNAHALLPTLRSRLHIISSKRKVESNKEAEKFIKMAISERLLFVETLVKEQKEEGSKVKIRSLLQGIIRELEKDSDKKGAALKAACDALLYIDDKGASMKLLLESVALAI
jgi:DNA polymerase III delta prime subunit